MTTWRKHTWWRVAIGHAGQKERRQKIYDGDGRWMRLVGEIWWRYSSKPNA